MREKISSFDPTVLLEISASFKQHQDAAGYILTQKKLIMDRLRGENDPEKADQLRAEIYSPKMVIPRLVSYYYQYGLLKDTNPIKFNRMRKKINKYLNRIQKMNPDLYEVLESPNPDTGKTLLRTISERFTKK